MNDMMICDVGMYLPKKILHNNDLPDSLDTNHEWIHQRTGIETRRIAAENETTGFMAYNAVKDMKFKNLKMIIVATSTPDVAFPSCASYLHQKLSESHGLCRNIMCFDVHDACNGFVQTMDIALQYLNSFEEYSEVLIVGSETMTKLIDWTDRGTAILFGDGAGSMLLNNSGKVLYKSSKSIPNYDSLNTSGNKINMNGREVFKTAVRSFSEDVNNAMNNVGEIDWFVPHQANLRIIESVLKNTKLNEKSLIYNGNLYGNTSAASIPIAFHQEFSKMKKGHKILFSAFGAGLRGSSLCIQI
ncbi:beta-ketoacyl-ACP synthase 3 [Candidatus Cytomitobacter indipagum]|uniref:Beta-ketoacyl-ACP synthase 3 n=1 Tax=Candidatus Cytomitobacter indipagum TaxID=2601575 RepID=A0A5C0UD65_9PROT|nr:beta-ketoacyl-ACP synthase 3 [Candidatus Cytomitobacter indipagum]QEK37918.1 beta-ketoacyl-ACP synthase 3 [Candidatus Cytomitobacter indipagum]